MVEQDTGWRGMALYSEMRPNMICVQMAQCGTIEHEREGPHTTTTSIAQNGTVQSIVQFGDRSHTVLGKSLIFASCVAHAALGVAPRNPIGSAAEYISEV